MLKIKKTPKIVKRNLDVEHIMLASCYYGYHGLGIENKEKIFSMLITTDVHGCARQFNSAIKYLNYYDAIDMGICLGDIQPADFKQPNDWYVKLVKKSKKPFLSVLGNHDIGNSAKLSISATPKMAMQRYYAPNLDKIGIEKLEEPYYLKLVDKYKIAILVLNCYDAPDDKVENGDYAVHRGYETFSQKQIDFIIKSLNEIPSDYHLMIAMHNFPYLVNIVDCKWSQSKGQRDCGKNSTYDGDIIPDIINAWINGGKLKEEYKPRCEGVLKPLIADCDFSKRGEGVFVGYFVGHVHFDNVATCVKYENQNVIFYPSTALDLWQNHFCDVPRTLNTKAEDCITVTSIRTDKREIRLVRIGSNFTLNMQERISFSIKY